MIELRAEFEPGPSSVLTLKVRGVEIVYDAAKQEIRVGGPSRTGSAPAGKQRLIVFADRTGLEVFASDGLTYVPMPINLDPGICGLDARVSGGPDQARFPRCPRTAQHLGDGRGALTDGLGWFV